MERKCNFNKFLTLFENDFYRSLITMLPMIFIFSIAQVFVAWRWISGEKERIDNILINEPITEFLNSRGTRSFDDLFAISSITFVMGLSVLAIVLYTLFLWNREWMGSSKSIYTLLNLPIKRSYILFSKWLTMIVFLSFNLLVQISTLFIDKKLMAWMIDERLYVDQSVLGVFSTNYYKADWYNLISRGILVSIVTVIALVLLLSLAVLLFRSFKIKGLILGVIFLAVYIGPYIGVYFYFNLFMDEYFIFKLIFSMITCILSFIYSKYLLENKVGV